MAGGPGDSNSWRPCGSKVHYSVAVAKFIVIPGTEFDKVVIEGSSSIEGGAEDVPVKVIGNSLILGIALEGTL